MKTIATLALLLLLVSPSISVADTTAADVIDQYIEALGGKESIAKCESRHIEADFEIPGMTGKLDVYTAKPEKYRLLLVVEGFGEFEEGATKGRGWTLDPMSGAQLMTDEQLASTMARTGHNGELHYSDRYESMALAGEEEFDGVKCYKLRLEASWGSSFEFFEIETGLLRGTQGDMIVNGGAKVAMTIMFREYAEFSGRLYASKTVQSTPMGEQTITVTGVTHDSVKDDAFVPPKQVLPLLEAN